MRSLWLDSANIFQHFMIQISCCKTTNTTPTCKINIEFVVPVFVNPNIRGGGSSRLEQKPPINDFFIFERLPLTRLPHNHVFVHWVPPLASYEEWPSWVQNKGGGIKMRLRYEKQGHWRSTTIFATSSTHSAIFVILIRATITLTSE